jgi:hypothetical protein
MLRLLVRSRWNLLRLALAAALLWAVAIDAGPRLARLQLAALADFDHASEVRQLRDQGRFAEAVIVADAGLERTTDPARLAELRQEREQTLAAQSSWLRRARELGLGAISGQGDSLEALVGAVAADLLVVGDVRDLLIQGARLALDGQADPVIAGLSALGIATTVAPVTELGVTLTKVARKLGVMSVRLGEKLLELIRLGRREALFAVAGDVGTMAAKASPGGALRLVRLADAPEDLAMLARTLESRRGAAFALHVTGADGVAALRRAGPAAQDAALDLLEHAARKGETGRAFLRSRSAAILLRPHPIIGLAKGFYKGNLQALAARAAEWIDPRAWWILPALASWVFLELALLFARLRGATPPGQPAQSPTPGTTIAQP